MRKSIYYQKLKMTDDGNILLQVKKTKKNNMEGDESSLQTANKIIYASHEINRC